ncbi:glycosyltransferase family 1 protein [Peptostreptococcaceae bacterium OttesenSCG-928-C18]|nr:glycosyltransferase family 1 protein [Peptostreptococcaceae bacterium OttesenSCG-928-C18]
MKKIIYHIPYFVDKNRQSGSHIRPVKMFNAFKNIGYEVDTVMGYGNSRKESIQKIKNNIKNGVKYEFCYSESSTMPTLLTEANHLPKYPFLDFGFFKFLKNNNIKIGLFYRDCHWLFDQYKKTVSKPKQIITSFFYKYDLKKYKKYVDVIYMPDKEMNKYLPVNLGSNVQNLPPAIDKAISTSGINNSSNLNIFYVGGLGELYNFEMFFKVIEDLDFINLTLCTREGDWINSKKLYSKYLNDRISIIHKGPGEYDKYIESSDLALLFAKPDEYWKFAIPVKLFEYIKFRKPIIAVQDTATSNIIKKYNIGYTLPYNEESLKNKLVELHQNKKELEDIVSNFDFAIAENTWDKRAEKVKNDLSIKIKQPL